MCKYPSFRPIFLHLGPQIDLFSPIFTVFGAYWGDLEHILVKTRWSKIAILWATGHLRCIFTQPWKSIQSKIYRWGPHPHFSTPKFILVRNLTQRAWSTWSKICGLDIGSFTCVLKNRSPRALLVNFLSLCAPHTNKLKNKESQHPILYSTPVCKIPGCVWCLG